MVFNSHLAVKCAKDALGEIVEDNPEQQLFGLTFIIDRGLQKLRYIKTNGPTTTVRLVKIRPFFFRGILRISFILENYRYTVFGPYRVLSAILTKYFFCFCISVSLTH